MRPVALGHSLVAIAAICSCSIDAFEVLEREHESNDLMKTVYSISTDGGQHPVTCSVSIDNDNVDLFIGQLTKRNSFGLISLALNGPRAEDFQKMQAEHTDLPYAIHFMASIGTFLVPMGTLCVQICFAAAVLTYQLTHRFQVTPEEEPDADSTQVSESRSLLVRAVGPVKSERLTVKVAAFSVVVLYVSRFWMIAALTYSMAFTNYVPIEITGGVYGHDAYQTSWIADGGCLNGSVVDFFITWIIDIICPFMNIFVVYHSESVMDVVLNSLAMEFVANLDNEYKSLLLDGFRAYSRYVIDSDVGMPNCMEQNCIRIDTTIWSEIFCFGTMLGLVVCGGILLARK